MHIKKGFTLRDVCGEKVIVSEGKENIDFSNIISLNESSAYLWENVISKEFTAEDLKRLLLGKYNIDEKTALEDSESIIKKWLEADIIE